MLLYATKVRITCKLQQNVKTLIKKEKKEFRVWFILFGLVFFQKKENTE
jgi:hypothetical protein